MRTERLFFTKPHQNYIYSLTSTHINTKINQLKCKIQHLTKIDVSGPPLDEISFFGSHFLIFSPKVSKCGGDHMSWGPYKLFETSPYQD